MDIENVVAIGKGGQRRDKRTSERRCVAAKFETN